MPSLEDIQARMSKKTFSKDGISSTDNDDTKDDLSKKLEKDQEVLKSKNGSSSTSTSNESKAAPALINNPAPKASGLAAAAEIPTLSTSPTRSSSSIQKPAMPAVKIIGEKPSNEQIKKASVNPSNPRELIGEDGKKLHPLQHKW